MLKYPKSPLLVDVLFVGFRDDDPLVDTTSVTDGSCASIVVACAMAGRTLVEGVPNKLREGDRSQDGIEGMPTDHPVPLAESFAAEPRMSTLDANVDGG